MIKTELKSPVPTAAMHAAIGRDIVKEMADFMRANPGCTPDELRIEGGFSSRHIERYGTEATDLANLVSTRRVA